MSLPQFVCALHRICRSKTVQIMSVLQWKYLPTGVLCSLFFKREMELAMIGLNKAGKSTLVEVLASGSFNEDLHATVRVPERLPPENWCIACSGVLALPSHWHTGNTAHRHPRAQPTS